MYESLDEREVLTEKQKGCKKGVMLCVGWTIVKHTIWYILGLWSVLSCSK